MRGGCPRLTFIHSEIGACPYNVVKCRQGDVLSDLAKLIVTAALAFASGIAAALVGAFYVHKLTRSRDHDIWVRDSRMKEWQELLECLTAAYMKLLSSTMSVSAMPALENEKQRALADVDIMLSTRIFIADDVSELEVREKWAAFVGEYRSGQSLHQPRMNAVGKQTFKDRFQGLRKSLVEVAKKTK